MTKKEVALIKEAINSFKFVLEDNDPMCPLTEEVRLDSEARMDALVWVLVATGNDEGLDPSLRAEEFK